MKLSIIIPVYNVEAYVESCIMSCVNQDIPLNQYEIIILNDGSTDASLEVVQRLSEKYSNIKVYSHDNQGLSLTRNTGLELASGTYIWFVDSDDSIEDKCLSSLLEEASGVDMLAFGCKDYEDGNLVGEFRYGTDARLTGCEFMVETTTCFMHGAPFYLFRREFMLNCNLKFYPGIYHEDTELIPKALLEAGVVKISKGSWYHRNIRSGSITRSINPKRAYDLLFVAERLSAYISAKQLPKSVRKSFLLLLPIIMNNSLNLISNCPDDEIKRFNSVFANKKLFKYYLASRNLRYVIEGIALFLFRKHPVAFYRMIKK